MWKYALTLSYLGAGFCGWQSQRKRSEANPEAQGVFVAPVDSFSFDSKRGSLSSVQDTLEAALRRLFQEPISAVASGRTDAGVHALGQVVHIRVTQRHWLPEKIRQGLNGLLPPQVRVLEVREVGLAFHAQKKAQRKQYSYYFQQGPVALPVWQPYSWWIARFLDLQAMQQSVLCLLGTHDFRAFQASGSSVKHTVRTVFEIEVSREPTLQGGPFCQEASFFVRLRVVGSGFLKQMVRSLAGTLVQVGEGKRSSSCFEEILRTQDRQRLGQVAPGRGLWLEKVWYEPENVRISD